ncbi:hypothetical protein CBS101457_000131 [Exobasidium rhododendri]|nr:hypothetical protein CBS101457_000131 [Exobasidium rhododendri]
MERWKQTAKISRKNAGKSSRDSTLVHNGGHHDSTASTSTDYHQTRDFLSSFGETHGGYGINQNHDIPGSYNHQPELWGHPVAGGEVRHDIFQGHPMLYGNQQTFSASAVDVHGASSSNSAPPLPFGADPVYYAEYDHIHSLQESQQQYPDKASASHIDPGYLPVSSHGRSTNIRHKGVAAHFQNINQVTFEGSSSAAQSEAAAILPSQGHATYRTPRSKHPKYPSSFWYSYSDDLKEEIVHILHLYTGLLKESIIKKCREHMTEALKDVILNKVTEGVLSARDILYSQSTTRNGYFPLEQKWMHGMSMEDSIRVVAKIADTAKKDAEHIRNFFLRTNLSARTAREILNDEYGGSVCQRYVLEMGLDRPITKMIHKGHQLVLTKTIEVWPWMKKISEDQKKTVVDKVMKATGLTKEECYALMKSPHFTDMTGTELLVARDAQIKNILQAR